MAELPSLFLSGQVIPEALLVVSFDGKEKEIATDKVQVEQKEHSLVVSIDKTTIRLLIFEAFKIVDEPSLSIKYSVLRGGEAEDHSDSAVYRQLDDRLILLQNQTMLGPPQPSPLVKQYLVRVKVQRKLKKDTNLEEEKELDDVLNDLFESEIDEEKDQIIGAPQVNIKVVNPPILKLQAVESKMSCTTQTVSQGEAIEPSLGMQILQKLTRIETEVKQLNQKVQQLESRLTGNFSHVAVGPQPLPESTPLLNFVRSKSVASIIPANMQRQSQGQRSHLADPARRPDIVFAFANVFGEEDEKNNFRAYPQHSITNPDEMFDKIVQAAKHKVRGKSEGKSLLIEKRYLNFKTFDAILEEGPRLLFIFCHGKRSRTSGATQFIFESHQKPYLADCYDEVRLLECLQDRGSNSKIDVIVLSTCHSEKLGQILLKSIKPAPAIIAINADQQVLETSTFLFNPKFIEKLIDGESVQQAVKKAQQTVATSESRERICCCLHSHHKDCLFEKKVKELASQEAAHDKFHRPQCNCYHLIKQNYEGNSKEWAWMQKRRAISHMYDCKEYSNFYQQLRRGVNPEHLIDWQNKYPDFVKEPHHKYQDANQRKLFNYWCCCSSSLAHQESDKFVIVNSLDDSNALAPWTGSASKSNDQSPSQLSSLVQMERKSALMKKDIFGDVPAGEIHVVRPSFKNVIGLKDNSASTVKRKQQVKEIIDFMLGVSRRGSSDRLLIIHGIRGVGKIETVAKAVWYAKEHEVEAVADGAFLVDLGKALSMRDIFKAIIERLKLDSKEPERRQILESASLNMKKCVLVFQGLREGTDLQTEFLEFLYELSKMTDFLKTIVLIEHRELLPEAIDESFHLIEVGNLTRDQALDYFLHLVQNEKKWAYIGRNKVQHLDESGLLAVWEAQHFREKFARDLVSRLGQSTDLDALAKEFKECLEKAKNAEKCEDCLSPDLAATDREVVFQLTELKNAGFSLLTDLLCVLAICPAGLCLSELKIMGQQMLRGDHELSEVGCVSRIDQCLSVMQELSRPEDQVIHDEINSLFLNNEEYLQRETIKTLLKGLNLRFETLDYIQITTRALSSLEEETVSPFIDEVKVEFSPTDRTAILQNWVAATHGAPCMSKAANFAFAVKFYALYANFILVKLRSVQEDTTIFPSLTVQSADLSADIENMWNLWAPRDQVSDQKCFQSIFKQKFTAFKEDFCSQRWCENRANMVHLLQISTVRDLSPSIFDENGESEAETQRRQELWENFLALSVLVPSILAKTLDFDLAIQVIRQVREILERQGLKGADQAIQMQTDKTKALLDLMHASFRLHQHWRSEQDIHSALQSESFRIEFCDLRDRAKTSFEKTSEEVCAEGIAELHYLSGIYLAIKTTVRVRSRSCSLVNEETSPPLQPDAQLARNQSEGFWHSTEHQCFEQALQSFRKRKRLHFAEVKCMYELLRLEMKPKLESDLTNEATFFRTKKTELLERIKLLEDKSRKVTNAMKIRTLIKSKKGTMNMIRLLCEKFRAQVYLHIESYGTALKCLHKALKKAGYQGASKAESAPKRKQRSSQRTPSMNRSASFASFNSGSQEISVDNCLVQQLKQLKTFVLEKLNSQKSNMFTFLRASPIIYRRQNEDGSGVQWVPLQDKHRSRFYFVSAVRKRLEKAKRNVKVKFDVLTKKIFRNTVENGAYLLHITSDVVEDDCLIFETQLGEAKLINRKKLADSLHHCADNMDVASIALPSSLTVGQIFLTKGTKHVLCFDSNPKLVSKSQDEEDDLIQPRLNYINLFCIEFYGRLAEGLSVRDAFVKAELSMPDQKQQVWDSASQNMSYDVLNLRPVLLPETSPRQHENQIAESVENSPSPEESSAEVCDISKVRAHMTGVVTKDLSPFFGQKVSLHSALHFLTQRTRNPPIVLVSGKCRVGKTRFVQEICHYFYTHNQFRHAISMQDLSKVNTEEHFVNLIAKLNTIVKSHQMLQDDRDDLAQQEVKREAGDRAILWAFTNVDMLRLRYWNRLESFLFDTYKAREKHDLRIVLTRNSDNSRTKFKFKNFIDPDRIRKEAKHPQLLEEKQGIRVQRIILESLKQSEAVELLLANCERRLTSDDFFARETPRPTALPSRAELITQQPAFQGAQKMPLVLLKLAKKLADSQNRLCLLRVVEITQEEITCKKFKKSDWRIDIVAPEEPLQLGSRRQSPQIEANSNFDIKVEPQRLPQSILRRNSQQKSFVRSDESESGQTKGSVNKIVFKRDKKKVHMRDDLMFLSAGFAEETCSGSEAGRSRQSSINLQFVVEETSPSKLKGISVSIEERKTTVQIEKEVRRAREEREERMVQEAIRLSLKESHDSESVLPPAESQSATLPLIVSPEIEPRVLATDFDHIFRRMRSQKAAADDAPFQRELRTQKALRTNERLVDNQLKELEKHISGEDEGQQVDLRTEAKTQNQIKQESGRKNKRKYDVYDKKQT